MLNSYKNPARRTISLGGLWACALSTLLAAGLGCSSAPSVINGSAGAAGGAVSAGGGEERPSPPERRWPAQTDENCAPTGGHHVKNKLGTEKASGASARVGRDNAGRCRRKEDPARG